MGPPGVFLCVRFWGLDQVRPSGQGRGQILTNRHINRNCTTLEVPLGRGRVVVDVQGMMTYPGIFRKIFKGAE